MPTNLEKNLDEIAIADAVVDLLDGGEFSSAFQIKRYDEAEFALKDLPAANGILVAIIAATPKRQQLTRGGAQQVDYPISVAVLRHVDRAKTTKLDDTDQVRLLAGELAKYLEQNPLENVCANVRQTNTDIHWAISPQHLDQHHAALGLRTITYRVFE